MTEHINDDDSAKTWWGQRAEPPIEVCPECELAADVGVTVHGGCPHRGLCPECRNPRSKHLAYCRLDPQRGQRSGGQESPAEVCHCEPWRFNTGRFSPTCPRHSAEVCGDNWCSTHNQCMTECRIGPTSGACRVVVGWHAKHQRGQRVDSEPPAAESPSLIECIRDAAEAAIAARQGDGMGSCQMGPKHNGYDSPEAQQQRETAQDGLPQRADQSDTDSGRDYTHLLDWFRETKGVGVVSTDLVLALRDLDLARAQVAALTAERDRWEDQATRLAEWNSNQARMIVTLKAERDALRARLDAVRALCAEILDTFTQKGHPGRECRRSGWIAVDVVREWRAALDGDAGGDDQ